MKINSAILNPNINQPLTKCSFNGISNIVSKQDVFQRQMSNLFENFSMNSANPLFELNNNNFIAKLSKKLFNNPDAPIKVGITGESGSGKRW